MGKSKEDRRFEILDGRLIDVQDRLRKLNRKVEEYMSEFTDAVQAIKDDVVRIGDGVKAVLAKLQEPNPDVVSATAALKEADAGLDAAAEAMEAVINPPTPAP